MFTTVKTENKNLLAAGISNYKFVAESNIELKAEYFDPNFGKQSLTLREDTIFRISEIEVKNLGQSFKMSLDQRRGIFTFLGAPNEKLIFTFKSKEFGVTI